VAEKGEGATVNGRRLGGVRPKERLGIVDLEATTAALIAEAAARLDGHVGRIRVMGALALALCELADGRLDGVASLKPSRSVDIAAASLIVREAGGAVFLPDDPNLALDLVARSRVTMARDDAMARRLAELVYGL
jgi:myo-inositol-1(or 4)-monophosphatase